MLHDIDLAKRLWGLANKRPIRDLELAGASLNLAFELGLSREAVPLLERLSKAANKGRGPLRAKTLEETVAMIREQIESGRRIAKLYEEVVAAIATGRHSSRFRDNCLVLWL